MSGKFQLGWDCAAELIQINNWFRRWKFQLGWDCAAELIQINNWALDVSDMLSHCTKLGA